MNILVLAAFISPYKGSEYSVAWNYVKHMSKYNNLTVVYGSSGTFLGDCSVMEKYAKEYPIKNVEFVAVHANKKTNFLNTLNRKGIFVYSFYLAFESWQKQAYAVAKELVKKRHYDLCHMVGPIGYREPGFFWKLGLPFMWGPIGGANNAPWKLVRHIPLNGMIKQSVRSIINSIQLRGNRRVKQALNATDLLLTCTTENREKFLYYYDKDSLYLPENAIDTEICVNEEKYGHLDTYNFIIVGCQDDRKNSILFLRSLLRIKNIGRIHLDVVGGGPAIKHMQEFALKNGISDRITWHGQLPRDKAVSLFKNAHMHVLTSISEGNPTVILEAMSYGVPTLSLDHCGMHDTIDENSGVLIPIHSYQQCIRDIAKEVDLLIDNPHLFKKLSDGTVIRSELYLWKTREMFLLDCYKKTISNFNKKLNNNNDN